MYIEKYWDNYIGGSDDSMTLLDYLAEKGQEELYLWEIFSESGLDKLESFAATDGELILPIEGMEAPISYAISLIADLAAIMLECKINGSVSLSALSDMHDEELTFRIIATDEEQELINKALSDFVAAPLTYDISEMMEEEELLEMADICETLRKELYE